MLDHQKPSFWQKLGFCLADITALEAEIDRRVYQLYGLTEEEIAIIEAKQ